MKKLSKEHAIKTVTHSMDGLSIVEMFEAGGVLHQLWTGKITKEECETYFLILKYQPK